MLNYSINLANATQISEHLRGCDSVFVPPLSDRIQIDAYTRKIVERAVRFEAWANSDLVGLVAAYCNDRESSIAFITNVSVTSWWQGKGIAMQLVENCINYVSAIGFTRIELKLDRRNMAAISLYKKKGFSTCKLNDRSETMSLAICKEV